MHVSQYGFKSAGETPQSDSIGLITSPAAGAEVTWQGDDVAWAAWIAECTVPWTMGAPRVILNGRIFGAPATTLAAARDALKRRVAEDPPYHATVRLANGELVVDTSAGRHVRPLLVAARYPPPPGAGLHALIQQGYAEYVDAAAYTFIAMDGGGVTPEHTHVEFDTLLLKSHSEGRVPMLMHNPSARVSLQSVVATQAVGFSSLAPCWETGAHRLDYHQTAICTTRMERLAMPKPSRHEWASMLRRRRIGGRSAEVPADLLKHVCSLPSAGSNAIVAVLALPEPQEDSMVLAEQYVQFGAMRSTKDVVLSETVERPGVFGPAAAGTPQAAKLDDDGIVPVGAVIQPGDVVMCMRSGEASVPVKYRWKEPGRVKTAMLTTDARGNPRARVRVRCQRVPQVGDKFASRHAQKGVVSCIYPREKLPFTSQGITPDIVINPHAFPSRMTIAHLVETLCSKLHCLPQTAVPGYRAYDYVVDGSGRVDHAAVAAAMRATGMLPSGNETMYDGVTGELLATTVFIGPCFYQRLNHMVVDKEHVRAMGPVSNLTWQPLCGRAVDGGLRVGEMEGLAIAGSGASNMLRGRLCLDSDAAETAFCAECGIEAYRKQGEFVCANKDCDGGEFNEVTIPHAFRLLIAELRGANMQYLHLPRMLHH